MAQNLQIYEKSVYYLEFMSYISINLSYNYQSRLEFYI